MKIRIDSRFVGKVEPTLIIAEAGANHNRDFNMAKEFIDVAADAKADAVKFQTYSAETLYPKKTAVFSKDEGFNSIMLHYH
ncbi:MAG: N-acetylneuraminate synthase family protein [Candidatus Eremiobacteraeota bacterium]|nr:N-acetylneuraminate synthase family protein [Candidatus Eremiobacteraeota bacterium]